MPENRPPALTDAHTIRLVIVFAFLLALICLSAGLFLEVTNHKDGSTPLLLSAGTGTIPALFALLARTSTAPAPGGPGAPPASVSVANTAADPVPVAQTPAPDAPADAPDETPAAPAADPADPPT